MKTKEVDGWRARRRRLGGRRTNIVPLATANGKAANALHSAGTSWVEISHQIRFVMDLSAMTRFHYGLMDEKNSKKNCENFNENNKKPSPSQPLACDRWKKFIHWWTQIRWWDRLLMMNWQKNEMNKKTTSFRCFVSISFWFECVIRITEKKQKKPHFFSEKKVQYSNETNGLSKSNNEWIIFTGNDIEIWSKIGIAPNNSQREMDSSWKQ